MSQVRVTLKQLGITEKGKTDLGLLLAEMIREQCAQGISASGEPFPAGKGDKKRLDMSDSGDLLRDIAVFSGSVRFSSDHAAIVQKLYNFAGLAPQKREEFLRRAAEIIGRELHAEDR